jgi:hypothetical protein
MTLYGAIFMTLSVGAVITLVVWCYYRVLTLPPEADDS